MGNKQLKSGNGTLQPVPEQRTFVVFAVAGYHLALPIEIIVQVIRCPARLDSDLGKAGLMQIGQHLIQVINIEQKSDESCDRQPGGNQDFLIVIADPEKKLYGIVVDEPPNLMKQPSEGVLKVWGVSTMLPIA
ncbi:chemotaxis protein CheW [Leptolyngbya ohadii]|uniref:chemotaxis protein CheW n=1 Tax=Leptolyngbya ohadii TaxID=1962290 RepID=UPI00117B2E76|nr:chemotaxis protein CheW [Leptolyngbya ohadii]